MVRRGRSISKDDLSILTDSALSLSSTNANESRLSDEDNDIELEGKLQVTDDEDDIEFSPKSLKLNRNEGPEKLCHQKSKKEYICEVCQKQFRGKTDLKRHTLIHSGERPHKCEHCGKGFRQAVNLKNHITIVHKGQKTFSCTLCSKTFALKERLRLHMRIHSGEKPYECKECNKRFARRGQLTQHLITNHKTSAKKYKCEMCSAGFLTAGNLRAHFKRHEEGVDSYCQQCNKHFPNSVILQAHLNKTHEQFKSLICEICKEEIKSENFASHMKNHSKSKIYVCDFCNSCFSQKSQYNVHIRMHSGERPYQCRICMQTFAHSSVLKLHIRKHTGEKPFKCVLCEDVVAFSQLAHLKTHMKKVHKQNNPYMCEGCNKFFKTKADLQLHINECQRYKSSNIEEINAERNEKQTLSELRLLIAILLKKISSEQKLKQLGFEKRLIDNVVISALKLANRKACDSSSVSSIDRLRLNVEEFLNWIVPQNVMEKFRAEQLSVDTILDKIVALYIKHK